MAACYLGDMAHCERPRRTPFNPPARRSRSGYNARFLTGRMSRPAFPPLGGPSTGRRTGASDHVGPQADIGINRGRSTRKPRPYLEILR